MTQLTEKKLVSVREAAVLMGMGKTALYEMIEAGQFPARLGLSREALPDSPPVRQDEGSDPRARVLSLVDRSSAVRRFGRLRLLMFLAPHTHTLAASRIPHRGGVSLYVRRDGEAGAGVA